MPDAPRLPATCRHCRTGYVNRPRGLCWPCYYTPGVRDLYPSTSKHARRGVGNGFLADPPLPEPTEARPGTPEKLAVLASRALAGQRLWHPEDSFLPPDGPPSPPSETPNHADP